MRRNGIEIATMVLSYVLIAIVCLGGGFFAGREYGKKELLAVQEESSIDGVYYATSWNGREATLVLNSDGTCIYPFSSKPDATWTADDNMVTINYNGEHKAIITDVGLILHDCLFTKLK